MRGPLRAQEWQIIHLNNLIGSDLDISGKDRLFWVSLKREDMIDDPGVRMRHIRIRSTDVALFSVGPPLLGRLPLQPHITMKEKDYDFERLADIQGFTSLGVYELI